MAGWGRGSSGRVRPASLHSSGPLYAPGSRPSAGSPCSFHGDGDFLAAKKMGSMSASIWCLAANPGGAGPGENMEPAEPQEADAGCGEVGDRRRPAGSSARPGGWGSPAGVGSAGRLPAGLMVILRFLSWYFVCIDHTFLWLKFCSERSPPSRLPRPMDPLPLPCWVSTRGSFLCFLPEFLDANTRKYE